MKHSINKHILNKRDEVLGKEFETNNFGRCFVIDYSGTNNVAVAFYQPFCIVKCSMLNLKRGRVSNPMKQTVYGKGYLGVGKYSPSSETRVYKLWKNMLERVYCSNVRYARMSYEGVEVCEEWCNFQNFAEWCETQKFLNAKDVKGKSYQLDKDILVKGSKVYSPKTCCFVPPEINSLFIKQQNTRGEFPIGVWFDRRSGKYQACVSKNGETVCLGLFETPKKAFEHYKKVKESHIKEVAEIWKDRIDGKVYKALLTWEIEEND